MPHLRKLSRELLLPHPAISAAYVLWASIEHRARPGPVDVIRSGRSYLWFGGFVGIGTSAPEEVEVHVHRSLPEGFIDAAWAEAASADGVLDIGNWYQKLTLLLPEDQRRRLFGPRGLTKTSAARAAGITRPTLYAALRAAQ